MKQMIIELMELINNQRKNIEEMEKQLEDQEFVIKSQCETLASKVIEFTRKIVVV